MEKNIPKNELGRIRAYLQISCAAIDQMLFDQIDHSFENAFETIEKYINLSVAIIDSYKEKMDFVRGSD